MIRHDAQKIEVASLFFYTVGKRDLQVQWSVVPCCGKILSDIVWLNNRERPNIIIDVERPGTIRGGWNAVVIATQWWNAIGDGGEECKLIYFSRTFPIVAEAEFPFEGFITKAPL